MPVKSARPRGEGYVAHSAQWVDPLTGENAWAYDFRAPDSRGGWRRAEAPAVVNERFPGGKTVGPRGEFLPTVHSDAPGITFEWGIGPAYVPAWQNGGSSEEIAEELHAAVRELAREESRRVEEFEFRGVVRDSLAHRESAGSIVGRQLALKSDELFTVGWKGKGFSAVAYRGSAYNAQYSIAIPAPTAEKPFAVRYAFVDASNRIPRYVRPDGRGIIGDASVAQCAPRRIGAGIERVWITPVGGHVTEVSIEWKLRGAARARYRASEIRAAILEGLRVLPRSKFYHNPRYVERTTKVVRPENIPVCEGVARVVHGPTQILVTELEKNPRVRHGAADVTPANAVHASTVEGNRVISAVHVQSHRAEPIEGSQRPRKAKGRFAAPAPVVERKR